ncbi:MAG: DUF805 domain-containing protein [Lentisphaerae bacterium]|nr:DUF805 domain-containing protein [Lentisphaerota bacterium]
MAVKLYWNYHGRISRKKFWLGLLPILLIELSVFAIFNYTFSSTPAYRMNQLNQNLDIFLILVLCWPAFCLGTKRFHDMGLSGWWCLLNLIPYLGLVLTLTIQGFVKGADGPNRFGPDPLSSKENATTFYGKELSSSGTAG